MTQDGSLADIAMLSTSSMDGGTPRDEDREIDKEQALVVVMDDMEVEKQQKSSVASDPRPSSTEESRHTSVGTEPDPEPPTEQTSGTGDGNSTDCLSDSFHCVLSKAISAPLDRKQ